MFDYIFQIDGTIEVRLSASGYLQGGYWEPAQEGYGTAIRDTTMGSLHDHVINYKVGHSHHTKNRLSLMTALGRPRYRWDRQLPPVHEHCDREDHTAVV